jgi:hypothetical protein
MMPPLAGLLVVLALSPIVILLLHIVVHRLLTIGKRRVTGHGSAMPAIALGFVIVLAVATRLDVLRWGREDPIEIIAGAAYVAMVYGAMALLYVDAVNIAETSLTAHTLLEISWAGTLSDETLYSQYSADHMVRARLDRLTSLGQIRSEKDRYFLAGHWLLRFAQAVALWRTVIGLPAPILLRKRTPE